MKQFLHTLLLLLLLTLTIVFTNCTNKSQATHLHEGTHGKSTAPNYSIVFPNDKVNRIDIKIDKIFWESMNEDLESSSKPSGRILEELTNDRQKPLDGEKLGNRPHRPNREESSRRDSEIANDSTHFLGDGRRPDRPGPPPGGAPSEPTWNYCDVSFNNQLWNKVGIRYKGNSSLRMTNQMGFKKFSFKLDFDQFEDEFPEIKNQRFYGFKQLNLKNNYDDKSFMREKVASDLFADFGLVSPKTSFYRVYLDSGDGPVYFGLYTLVEEVDDTVIETQLESDDGNLYKPDGPAATFAQGTFNSSSMNKKNNKKSKDFSDLEKLNTILNSALRAENHEQWKSQLDEIFDVSIFLKWLAANTVMQNWDTYGNTFHNYYLYHNTSSNKLEWIPWDFNEALQSGKMGGARSLSLNELSENWPLIRYILDDELWQIEYKMNVSEFANQIFTPEKMSKIYSNYKQLITEYAIGEHGEKTPFTFLENETDFIDAFEFLNQHVKDRKIAVEEFLKEEYSVSLK